MKGRIIELEDRPNTQMQTVDSGMKGAQSEAVEKQRVIFQALQVIKRNKANSTVRILPEKSFANHPTAATSQRCRQPERS
jgi:hypothetical protein